MQDVTIPQSFKNSVTTIVRCEGHKGQAVDSLEKLHATVQSDYERAKGSDAEALLKAELDYLEGYMEGPAACLHDLKHVRKVRH